MITMELSTSEGGKTSSIHLRGELSSPPSRGLWLLKWLLIFPHLVVLIFLSFAVVFVTIFAFFAILFTGKYPRKCFNFVVGVFRWSWRIGFYAYSVSGTDKYPPFSLKSRDDYPADLHIDYPERLNHWLPLVKWFLAIPHFFVLMAFLGGVASDSDKNGAPLEPFRETFSITEVHVDGSNVREELVEPLQNSSLPAKAGSDIYDYDDSKIESFGFPGLMPVLVIIALFALLFTGRYHGDIFRLLMGINRWTYRVVAYVYFLTDEYPHFRLMD